MSEADFSLSPTLQAAVLERLGAPAGPPSPAHLQAIVSGYVRCLPWESASRIVRRAQHIAPEACPRWPVEFWATALRLGTGGTCFESNYALYCLLLGLGYSGYLTINDMGDLRGCHTALVIELADQTWLVDVGIPLYAPILIQQTRSSRAASVFHNYTLIPLQHRRFEVQRDRHPKPHIFTLINLPVAESVYRQATTADYGPGGLFLDRVIVSKVVGKTAWRFNSGELPWRVEIFQGGQRAETALPGSLQDTALQLSKSFGMQAELLLQALQIAALQ